MPDYATILTIHYPDRQFAVGDTYDTIRPLDGGTKPTQKKLDSLWPQVQYDRQVEQVRKARQARYTAETDPIFFQIQRGEGDATLQDWESAVNQIRADLPMPKEPS